MSQARLRIRVFSLWLIFWVISTVMVLCAPLRADKQIGPEQTLDLIYSLSGVWIPAITLLTAFWFPRQARQKARERRVAPERALAAFGLTAAYLFFVVALLAYALFAVDYSQIGDGRVAFPHQDVEQRVAAIVKLALMVSPAALAPINWLTGGAARPSPLTTDSSHAPAAGALAQRPANLRRGDQTRKAV